MPDHKKFEGLKDDQPFYITHLGETLVVKDPDLGVCVVDLSRPPSEQRLLPCVITEGRWADKTP